MMKYNQKECINCNGTGNEMDTVSTSHGHKFISTKCNKCNGTGKVTA